MIINKNVGFTLIEVLVAMIILALGLLGLAALQAGGVKFNQSAYYRSQATHLAYDLADRIRANASPVALAVYLDVNSNGAFDYQESPIPSGGTPSNNCKNATGCTPQQMAVADLNQWHLDLAAMLPKGCGSIMVGAAGAPVKNGCGGFIPATVASSVGTYTISINWDDNKDGKVDDNDPNFMMSFQL